MSNWQPDPKYEWRYLGDPILTTPTMPVASLDAIPVGLIQRMGELMNAGWTRGVGISANQVGATERICIVTLIDEDAVIHNLTRPKNEKSREERIAKVLINPVLVEHTEEFKLRQEACLSIPGFSTSIERYDAVRVKYRDESWEERTLIVRDFDAQVVQHELDHLNGKTLVDHVSRQQRRAAQRAVDKFLAFRRPRG